jgi:hypothetical protein
VKGVLPEELRRHFSFTFSQGYFNPSQRTTFSQWITAFGAIQQPAIHSFTADRATVNDKRPVRLGWEVTGARRLELRGIGDVTGRDFQDLMVSQSRVFELVLMPKSGNPITKSLRIEVDNRPPTIRSFQVDKTFLPDARPARLHWQVTGAVRVEITPSIGDVTGKPFVDVTPRQDTTYRLRAISGMDVEVSATVQVMVSKRAPVIEKFEVSPTVAFVGDEVSISWKISGAEVVSVSPSIGQVNLVGLRKIRATQTSSFTITAASHFGVVSTRVLSIYVAKRTALNVAPTTYAAERQTLNHLPTKLLTPSHENRRHITELVGSRADGWWKRRTKGTIT